MREIHPSVLEMITSGTASSFFLVKLETPSETLLHTNGPMPVTINGLGTFVTTNALFTVDSPRLSETVDKESYKIVYADPDFENLERFESGIVGANLTVWLCFMNTANAPIGGIPIGEPLNALEYLITAYDGTVDSTAITVSQQDGTVVAVIEASSPMGSLGQIRASYTSKESLAVSHPGDTSFDEIYVGSKKVALLWGKESVK